MMEVSSRVRDAAVHENPPFARHAPHSNTYRPCTAYTVVNPGVSAH